MCIIRILVLSLLGVGSLGSILSAQTHFTFTRNTGNNATVGVPLTTNPNISGSPLVTGDEIGVFTSLGLCVGAVVWDATSNAITVWGDNDQTPAVDGIAPGDSIRYRVWRQSTDTEYGSITVTYSAGNGVYQPNTLHTLSSLSAVAPPDAPTLVSPANGVTNQPTTVTLSWDTTARAVSYRVQVSTDSSFTSLVVDDSTVTMTSRPVTSLLNNTRYFWRINAKNSGGTSGWSTVWSFTTTLAAPVLASPADGATNQPTALPLSWNTVTGATSYRVQVSTSSSFTSFVVDDSTVTTTSRPVTSLLNNTTYFWRVNAKNSGGTGDWSTVRTFTTTLAAPVLGSPANGATDQQTTLTLSWNTVTGATSYRVQVSTSSSFTSFVMNDTTSSTSHQVTSLLTSTTYFWRVNATNTGGTSDWSNVQSFTTVPPPPLAPILASPADSATLQSTTLTLSWNASSGATSYRVQVSTNSSFTSLLVDDSTVTDPTRPVTSLTNATTYHWRVNAKNTGGISTWSSVRRFTTIGTPMTHGVTLALGWNMISSFVRPQNTNLDTLTLGIRSNMVIIKNGQGQVYWPAIPANTIGNWNYAHGYQVYMQAPDTLMIPGNEVIPDMNPLSLAQGWHLLSYMRNDSLAVDSALSSIAPNIVIVKNNQGQVYWPALGVNQIGKMKQGQGYQLYLSAASTLTYPPNNQSSPGDVITSRSYASRVQKKSANQVAAVVHFSFASNTGNNATIGIPTSANPSIDGRSLASGDEIGVFTPTGLCIGAVVWTGSNIAITVWGDDSQTSEIDGSRPGENFHYRVWQRASNQEFENVGVTYSEGDSSYAPDGISVLSSLGSSSATGIEDDGTIPTEFALAQNYPNPFNPSTTIRYDLPEAARVGLRLFDLLGREVAVLVDEVKPAGSYTVQFNAQALPSGVYIYRIAAGGFTEIRKMILLR